MSNIIEITDLVKRFGSHIVLNHISISFDAGKIHGITGRNGSGKTMLFKCILGLMPFDQGTIQVREQRIGKDIDVPDNVGMIIEGPGFLPNYCAYSNLRYLSLIRNTVTKEDLRYYLEQVGLDPKSRKWVSKYSMGMRQRLCIAQALMENPDILILDEPMNGLDNQGVSDIRALLQHQRASGKTILLASHNREDIDILCDDVYQMDAGSITQIR